MVHKKEFVVVSGTGVMEEDCPVVAVCREFRRRGIGQFTVVR